MKNFPKTISLNILIAVMLCLPSQLFSRGRTKSVPLDESRCSCQKPPKTKTETIDEACSSCQKPSKPEKKSVPVDESRCSCQRPPKTKTATIETKEATDKVTAEIAVGELIDKMTILQIKLENIKNEAKLVNIRTELEALTTTRNACVPQSDELEALTAELLSINKELWDIEDDIRDKERSKAFDEEFVELARAVYITNDKRCAVKRQINELTGSRLLEEKSYAAY